MLVSNMRSNNKDLFLACLATIIAVHRVRCSSKRQDTMPPVEAFKLHQRNVFQVLQFSTKESMAALFKEELTSNHFRIAKKLYRRMKNDHQQHEQSNCISMSSQNSVNTLQQLSIFSKSEVSDMSRSSI
mmetsp:Transcript_31111/g.41146  ORF Transcript_31111/g.41146 Transcript_31111/m.41146 type:complete len:129 (-) Transcript_31111:203-589(-)